MVSALKILGNGLGLGFWILGSLEMVSALKILGKRLFDNYLNPL
jgi:hypothetical protein